MFWNEDELGDNTFVIEWFAGINYIILRSQIQFQVNGYLRPQNDIIYAYKSFNNKSCYHYSNSFW